MWNSEHAVLEVEKQSVLKTQKNILKLRTGAVLEVEKQSVLKTRKNILILLLGSVRIIASVLKARKNKYFDFVIGVSENYS